MTSTAHEDQFTAAHEPVRETMSRESTLRRNVAALEFALKQQTELKEKAEAELARLAQQEPIGQVQESSPSDKWPVMRTLGEFPPIGTYLYADPAPAPAVPAEWREVMTELAADVQAACDAEHPHRDQYPSVMRKYNNDMEIVEKASALLQSAEVTK